MLARVAAVQPRLLRVGAQAAVQVTRAVSVLPRGVVAAQCQALSSQAGTVAAAEASDHWSVKRKQLLYRSKQRGMLELDLLIGRWAADNVPSMNRDELAQFERILQIESPDMFNYITGRVAVPEAVNNSVMSRLKSYADSSPFGHADPKAYEESKKVMAN